jgi:eukaryotic-like serine/threonine-protein kinase
VTYETIARLGRGGMGVVDLARDPEGNKVALKRLTLHGSANDIIRARQRLLREAEVLRRLHHPNVVGLIDVIDEGDEIVLVMRYLSGGSLAERVSQHGPAPADEVERQARRLFGALAQAHQLGIIHRDIKPANILFDDRGEPCLADFGVAQTWDQTHGLTVSGMVVGTPGFMAPEQARGEQAVPASDVFSLGATLLFAATGDGPFGAGDPALLMVKAASNKVEKVPRSLPASLRRLLSDTLQARPERRPTAAEVVGSPQGFMAGLPSVPRPRSGLSWAIVLGVAGAILLVLGAVAFIAGREREERQAPDQGAAPGATDGALAPDPDGDGACQDLPYQPCGQAEPAPNTDGARCVEGYEDYDADATNGCEAVPQPLDEDLSLRLPSSSVEATIVPRDDVDVISLNLDTGQAPDCAASVVVTLWAPEGMDLRLEVSSSESDVGDAVSRSGQAGEVTIEPCVGGAGGEPLTYEATVMPEGDARVAEPYILSVEVSGGSGSSTTTATA